MYRPGRSQFRLHIPLDPEQTRIDEANKIQKKEFDPKKLRPDKLVPLGPDDEGG
jgi:hypothetical protein